MNTNISDTLSEKLSKISSMGANIFTRKKRRNAVLEALEEPEFTNKPHLIKYLLEFALT